VSTSSHVTRRTAIGGGAAIATDAARPQRQGTDEMERVDGIGGLFFRAKDPKKLAEGNPIQLWQPGGSDRG
jgi:hypothetical protein